MSRARARATLWVGGLGGPHDTLLAAVLRADGRDAHTLGELDAEAFERGRAAFPRGQCAPNLYVGGALLGAADRQGKRPATFVSVGSCGPCRFALFAPAWRRALAEAGHDSVHVVDLAQSAEAWVEALGRRTAVRLLESLAVADVMAECRRRLEAHVRDGAALEARARDAADRVARAVAAGREPVDALREVGAWWVGLERRAPEPLARAVLVGEPWSLHVEGDGQLRLPRVLGRAGVEVDVPPVSQWVVHRFWELRQPRWGRTEPSSQLARRVADQLEQQLRDALARAGDAAGLSAFAPVDPDELAELARPHLPPAVRGGYGHVEIGLALDAVRRRRAHFVLSVKSFGCIPSSGITDAILPGALDPLPYLAVEVCGDGEAARESRLTMRAAAARQAAQREAREACAVRGLDLASASALLRSDPIGRASDGARRPYACTMACDVHALSELPWSIA